jgi:hypothetical protein
MPMYTQPDTQRMWHRTSTRMKKECMQPPLARMHKRRMPVGASPLRIAALTITIYVHPGRPARTRPKNAQARHEQGHAWHDMFFARTIWLNRFWCLMINITYGLMRLLVFVFVVHRMLKLLGPRQ